MTQWQHEAYRNNERGQFRLASRDSNGKIGVVVKFFGSFTTVKVIGPHSQSEWDDQVSDWRTTDRVTVPNDIASLTERLFVPPTGNEIVLYTDLIAKLDVRVSKEAPRTFLTDTKGVPIALRDRTNTIASFKAWHPLANMAKSGVGTPTEECLIIPPRVHIIKLTSDKFSVVSIADSESPELFQVRWIDILEKYQSMSPV